MLIAVKRSIFEFFTDFCAKLIQGSRGGEQDKTGGNFCRSNFNYCVVRKICSLSGSPAKSGPLDFGTKNNFPSFFVSEKDLVHIYINAIYYFPVLYFCFATSQNSILAEPRLPTVIRKVKFTDFVKRATSPKMQLTEFCFHMNSKVHSIL